MKKMLLILLVVVFAVSMVVIGSGCKEEVAEETPAAAEETPAAAEETPAAAEETPAAEEKDVSELDIVMVVKADGIPWFDTIRAGLDKCAADYGFKATTVGPPTADAALQAKMIEDYIAAGVEAIGVVPNDPASIEPVFEKARAQGIITFAHEGSSFKNVDFDLEAMSNQTFGEEIMKAGVGYSGETGQYVWSVGWLTSVSHNEWVDAGIALQQAQYPNKINALGYEKGADRFEEQEDTTIARSKMVEFIKTYPEINQLFGSPMTTMVAAGLVIEEMGLKDKVFACGTGLPITVGDHLRNGYVQEGFFWDPWGVGYAVGYLTMKLYLGEEIKDGEPVLKPDGAPLKRYEKISITTNAAGGRVIFGQGLERITLENLDEWDAIFKEYGF